MAQTSFERMQQRRVERGEPATISRTNEQSAATAARNVAAGHGTITQVPGTGTSSYVSNKGKQIINYQTPTSQESVQDINSIKPRPPGPSVPDKTTFGGQSNKKSIYDIYGMDQNAQASIGNITDPYAAYGLTAPVRAKADTAAYDAEIAMYKPQDDSEKIQQMLDKQLADIENRYGIERKNVERQTASEFQSQLSGLYNAGVVNPLSSGTGSIDAASDQILDRRISALNAEKEAEKSIAIANAYKQKTQSRQQALDFAKEERKRLEDQTAADYEYERQAMTDKIGMINNVVAAWQSGQAADRQTRLDAQKNISDVISNFGISAFDGMDETELSKLEQATGYPPGSLSKGIVALKQKELTGADMDLRSVGGSLYNVFRDKDGKIQTELILKGKETGGGGSKSTKGKFTDDFRAWYFESFNEIPDPADQNAQDEFERWNVTGKKAGANEREQQLNNPGNYSEQELRKLRAGGVDPKNIESADKFLYQPKNNPFQAPSNTASIMR